MARYYRRRFKARKKASSRRYRRYRRYKRYYRRNRRRYRRKISKPEVKRAEKSVSRDITVVRPSNTDGTPKAYMLFPTGVCMVIGSSQQQNWGLAIPLGTDWNRRIGRVIRPIKLRIFGNINCNRPAGAVGAYSLSVRLIVYQLRSPVQNNPGVNLPNPNSDDFSPWNPDFSLGNGDVDYQAGHKIFYNYYAGQFQADNGAMKPGVSIDAFARYQFLTRMPFKEGFGKACKLLYDGVFSCGVDQNLRQNKNFRIKTKCPKPMIWEWNTSTNDPDLASVCSNPIYIWWHIVPHQSEGSGLSNPGAYNSGREDFDLAFTAQLYYVDP